MPTVLSSHKLMHISEGPKIPAAYNRKLFRKCNDCTAGKQMKYYCILAISGIQLILYSFLYNCTCFSLLIIIFEHNIINSLHISLLPFSELTIWKQKGKIISVKHGTLC
jgi:hypothetical protein